MNKWSGFLLSALGLAVAAGSARADLAAVDPGPYGPATGGFPLWYRDANDLSLELCQSRAVSPTVQGAPGAPAYLCTLLPEPGVFDDTQPMVFPDNWPPELFWFLAETSIDPVDGFELVSYVAGVEAAFAQELPAEGDQVSFARIRIRASVPVPGIYTITHPYGVETVEVATAGQRAINLTRDIGIGAPGDFTGALDGDIGPFLTSTGGTIQAVNPDTGVTETFIGDPNVPGTLTGSPNGTNFVRIEGPDGISIETDQFLLSGKLLDSRPATSLAVERASYGRTAAGSRIDLFASSDTVNATVCYRETLALVNDTDPCQTDLTPDDDGRFFASAAPSQGLPPFVVLTAIDPSGNSRPSSLSAHLKDLVKIETARYSWADNSLTIKARSSDETAIPDLAAAGFGRLVKDGTPLQTLVVSALPQPPASITVKSAAGGSDTEPVTVVESAPAQSDNLPPVALDDEANTSEGVPVLIDLLINDSDEDGNTPLKVIDLTMSEGSLGSVAPDGSARALYTPPSSGVPAEGLVATFTYRAEDTRGGQSEPATVTVTISPNQPPTAGNDATSAVGDGTPVTIDVLINDTDPEPNLPLSIVNLTQPAAGQGSVESNGTSLTYTPPSGVTTAFTTSFTYQAQDSLGAVSSAAPVTVTVSAQPTQAPTALNDTASAVGDGTPVTIDVLTNDTDPEPNLPLSIVNLSQPAAGQGVVTNNGSNLTYTPPSNVTTAFTTTFTYQAQDSLGAASNTATVSVAVSAIAQPNQAPTAVPDTASTTGNLPVTIDVLANDTDPEPNLPLSIVNLTTPSQGSASISNGTVIYTPPGSVTAAFTATFNYQAQDNLGATSANAATVSVDVTPSQETLTVTTATAAQRQNGWSWAIVGTTDMIAGNSIEVLVGGVSLGTATPNASGRWQVRVNNSAISPDSGPVTVRSSMGTNMPVTIQ